ncbi:MAG: Trm112 family protein [Pirellulales bacterium]|nr:Trm112 family protein [Pirellulales bacterium]
MIDQQLLDLLVCPEDHSPLKLANAATLDRLNLAISEGRVSNRGGTKLNEPIGAGLVRADGKLLYPIIDDIPVMLVDEAIGLDWPD